MSYSIKFEHTAVATSKRDPVRTFVLDLLGGRVYVEQAGPQTEAGFRGVQIFIGDTMFEIIEPSSPTSFLHPYLAKRGPGLHHMTWYVKNLGAFIAELKRREVPLTGEERNPDGSPENVFIRPNASYGVLLQFRPDKDKGPEYKKNHPDWLNVPPPRPIRAAFVSTAIAVPDGDAAFRFFQSVLGGDAGPQVERDDATVRTLNAPGHILEILSPNGKQGRLAEFLSKQSGGIIYTTFVARDLTPLIEVANGMGLTLERGEDDGTFYLGRENPANAIFRFTTIAD